MHHLARWHWFISRNNIITIALEILPSFTSLMQSKFLIYTLISNLFCSEFYGIYFNLVFVIRRFGFEVLLCTESYFLVLGRNSRWNHKYWYSFDAERYTLWIQETPVSPKSLLRDDDYKFQGQTLKIAGVELRQDCFPHGQFYMACLDCKLTLKPGYFATILQNG